MPEISVLTEDERRRRARESARRWYHGLTPEKRREQLDRDIAYRLENREACRHQNKVRQAWVKPNANIVPRGFKTLAYDDVLLRLMAR